MNGWIVLVVGALAGLHAATWGGFKDSPFEGWRSASFVRSVVLGAGCGLAALMSGLSSTSGLLVVAGGCYAVERLVTEWWKAILREDPRATYTIPMRLAVLGRPVDARLPRYAAGVAVLVTLGAACVVMTTLDDVVLPWWWVAVVLGSGGWLTAFGGAWKDAPVEGFEVGKFFRSPVVATVWGYLLLPWSSSLTVTAVAAAGLSVATLETYKTFLAGGPPGKFAGRPQRFAVVAARARCRLLHGTLYGVLAAVLVATLLEVPDDATGADATATLAQELSCLVALVWATCCAALVLGRPVSATVEPNRASGRSAQRFGRRSDADIRGASK